MELVYGGWFSEPLSWSWCKENGSLNPCQGAGVWRMVLWTTVRELVYGNWFFEPLSGS